MCELGWSAGQTVTGAQAGSTLDQPQAGEEQVRLVRVEQAEGEHARVSGPVLLHAELVLGVAGQQRVGHTDNSKCNEDHMAKLKTNKCGVFTDQLSKVHFIYSFQYEAFYSTAISPMTHSSQFCKFGDSLNGTFHNPKRISP